MQSENVDKIAPAIVAAQRALRPVQKTASNPHFKSKFAPLEEIMGAAKEALHGQSIAVLQSTGDEDAAGFNVVTTLLHESGQWLSGRVRMPLERGTAQAAGSAVTYGRRYGLALLLGIVADEDDDGHQASVEQAMRPKAKPANGNGPPKKKPITERDDADLAKLRVWAVEKGKDSLVEEIDSEFERRRP